MRRKAVFMNQRTLTLEASYAPTTSAGAAVDIVDIPATNLTAPPRTASRRATKDPLWVRVLCIIVALTFLGLFYTLAQAGEPIVLRQFQAGGFHFERFIVLAINIVSAVAMLVFGIRAWRATQTPKLAAS